MFDPLIPVMDGGFIGDTLSSIWMEFVAANTYTVQTQHFKR